MESVYKIKNNEFSIQDIVINLFLIALGILFLYLQLTSFEILTTFLLGGLIFSFLGLYRLLLISYNYYINKYKIDEVTEENLDTDYNKRLKTTTKKAPFVTSKICPRCGQEYPEDTIHLDCILCGTTL
jgi:hypothetical protein